MDISAQNPNPTVANFLLAQEQQPSQVYNLASVIEQQTKMLTRLQKEKLIDAEAADQVSILLAKLLEYQCGICGLKGHASAHCWLNG